MSIDSKIEAAADAAVVGSAEMTYHCPVTRGMMSMEQQMHRMCQSYSGQLYAGMFFSIVLRDNISAVPRVEGRDRARDEQSMIGLTESVVQIFNAEGRRADAFRSAGSVVFPIMRAIDIMTDEALPDAAPESRGLLHKFIYAVWSSYYNKIKGFAIFCVL